jgi:predicted nuclease of restriction endonuclease-like (RecB) superfamily
MSKEITANKEYLQWLKDIKERIRSSQHIAALKVNQELLSLYWFIGETLATKQTEWGDKFIDNLARDLKVEFPDVIGYSKSNLKYMRRWYAYYSKHSEIGQQAVDQLRLSPDFAITQQVVAQIPDRVRSEISQQAVDLNFYSLLLSIPWGHHTLILTKAEDPEEAIFYIIKTIQNGWSRSVLQAQIESDLYNRQGKALTNFDITLPAPQSDIARETIKNPYNFEFLTLAEDVKEIEFERALIQHMKKFLLELGKGFAYVGNQYNLNVKGDDFFLDLLFYNTRLHCYVIFELKIGDFKPEYAGKLNFYQNAIDEQIKMDEDKPTIGMLLCKTPNKTVIEYSIKGINKPLGVSDYIIKKAVPKELKSGLPTVKELEQELEKEIEITKSPLNEKLEKLKMIIDRSTKEEIKVEKSKGAASRIVEKLLFPLMDNMIQMLKEKQIADWFIKFHHTIGVNGNEYRDRAGFNDAFNRQEIIDRLGFRIRLDAFKKVGTEPFDYSISYDIKLEKYKYNLESRTLKETPKYEWLYHKVPKKQEIDEIIINEVAEIVEYITRKMDKK